MHIENLGEGCIAPAQHMNDSLSPAQVDQFIRQALHFCWMAMPKEPKAVDELERQFRRLVERALKDFREDRVAFGEPRQT